MRSVILAWLGAGGLLLVGGASAEQYSIVEGVFTDIATGESSALSGGLEIGVPGTPLADDSITHIIDDFELKVGDQTFLPSLPVEFDGQQPIAFLQVADQIHFGPDRVEFFHLRSGGELVEVNGDEVTFRYFNFESTDSSGSSVSGPLPDSELPRRFGLQGTLYQVDQSFLVQDGLCSPILVPPSLPTLPPGGGVIVSGGGNITLHSFESFDLTLEETALFIPPSSGRIVLNRVTGGEVSLIEGELVSLPDAGIFFVNPDGIEFGETVVLVDSTPIQSNSTLTVAATSIAVAAHVLPTLEELNISAPDGAEISFDDGLLTVQTSGILTLSGSFPEIPGLTHILIIAGAGITVQGTFVVADGVSLELRTDGTIEFPGGVDDPPILVPGCTVLSLDGLLPVHPPEKTELGSFSITASAATQVEIDVLPWRDPNKLRLGTRQRIWVALLGSAELDVRDVDPSTLRLGPAEAEPRTRRSGRPRSFVMDIDRDAEGHRDLLSIFDLSGLGIAYGDTQLCLSAQTYSGISLEGCDSIDATPPRPRRSHWRDWFRAHRRVHHRSK